MQKFENRFQDCWKNTAFSTYLQLYFQSHKYITCEFLNGMYSYNQICNSKFDHTSLLDFYEDYLTREKYPLIHNPTSFMSSFIGSNHEQLFSRMKHMKSKISLKKKITDKHLKNLLRIATTSMKPDWCISFKKNIYCVKYFLCGLRQLLFSKWDPSKPVLGTHTNWVCLPHLWSWKRWS